MIHTYLHDHAWLVAILWALVYLSDYYLTIYAARLMRSALQNYISFQGSLELTPVFQKDINALNMFSRAFFLRLIFSIVLVLLIAYLAQWIGLPELYYFAIGGLFLREVPVHLRHFRNIGLARLARVDGSLRGKIEYSHWLNLKASAVDIWGYAAFFLLIAMILGSWFFFGGAFFCLITGFQHDRLAKKHRKALFPPPGENVEEHPLTTPKAVS